MEAWITPDVAYLLLVAGTAVLILALLTPGTGLLELAALGLLLAAGYTATQLTISGWAVGLWVLGLVFFGLSVRRNRGSAWWLVAALVSLAVGSVFVFHTPEGGTVSPWLAVTVSVLGGGLAWVVTRKVLAAEQRPPAYDPQRVVGQVAEVRTPLAPEGTVYVAGELWTARCPTPVRAGEKVRVVGREGLILQVEPLRSEGQ